MQSSCLCGWLAGWLAQAPGQPAPCLIAHQPVRSKCMYLVVLPLLQQAREWPALGIHLLEHLLQQRAAQQIAKQIPACTEVFVVCINTSSVWYLPTAALTTHLCYSSMPCKDHTVFA